MNSKWELIYIYININPHVTHQSARHNDFAWACVNVGFPSNPRWPSCHCRSRCCPPPRHPRLCEQRLRQCAPSSDACGMAKCVIAWNMGVAPRGNFVLLSNTSLGGWWVMTFSTDQVFCRVLVPPPEPLGRCYALYLGCAPVPSTYTRARSSVGFAAQARPEQLLGMSGCLRSQDRVPKLKAHCCPATSMGNRPNGPFRDLPANPLPTPCPHPRGGRSLPNALVNLLWVVASGRLNPGDVCVPFLRG